jgi:lipoprotein signal peptidase
LWTIAATVLVLDQLSKRWVLEELAHRGTMPVLGDVLRFSYVRNTGVAFGLFADNGFPFGWISVVALAVVLWLAVRPAARFGPRPLALGLILGGAAGNLIDRLRWGSVVDFIDIGIGSLRWWVFNVADSAITVGVVLWAVHAIFARAPQDATPAATSSRLEATPVGFTIRDSSRARDDARGA